MYVISADLLVISLLALLVMFLYFYFNLYSLKFKICFLNVASISQDICSRITEVGQMVILCTYNAEDDAHIMYHVAYVWIGKVQLNLLLVFYDCRISNKVLVGWNGRVVVYRVVKLPARLIFMFRWEKVLLNSLTI